MQFMEHLMTDFGELRYQMLVYCNFTSFMQYIVRENVIRLVIK